MEKNKKRKNLLEDKDLKENLELCEDIYKYYERKQYNIDYFDLKKNSVLYRSQDVKDLDGSTVRRFGRDNKSVRTNLMYQLLLFLFCIVFAVFLSKFVNGSLIQQTKVTGTSMSPTLESGERLLLSRGAYKKEGPKRFDIVVFSFNNGEHFVKRVIGLPGEKVQIKGGKVYINDVLLVDDPITTHIEYPGIVAEGITVEENQYFVLGDNRNNSYDSRYEDIGTINRKVILGKVWLRFLPLTKIGTVK